MKKTTLLIIMITSLSLFCFFSVFAKDSKSDKKTESKTEKKVVEENPDENNDESAEDSEEVKDTDKKTDMNDKKQLMILSDDIYLMIHGRGLFYLKYNTGKTFDNANVDGEVDSGYGFGFELDADMIEMLKRQLILGVSFEYSWEPQRNMIPLRGTIDGTTHKYEYGGIRYQGSTRIGFGFLGLWKFSNIPFTKDLYAGLRLMAHRNRSEILMIYQDYINNRQESVTQPNDAFLFTVSALAEAPIVDLDIIAIFTRLEIEYQIGKNDILKQDGLNVMVKAGIGF